MALVPAICTQCGAHIEVDDTHEAGICKHCGTAFITEKLINNYNMYLSVEHAYIISNHDNVETMTDRARTFVQLNEWDKALKVYDELIHKFPNDYRGWWGHIIVYTENFTTTHKIYDEHMKFYNNAITLADENTKIMILEKMNYYETKRLQKMENDKIIQQQAIKNAEICNKYSIQVIEKALGCSIKRYEQNVITDEYYRFEKFSSVYGHEIHYMLRGEKSWNQNQIVHKTSRCNEEIHDNLEELLSTYSSYKTKACYIATCVYGSYDCPQLWTLRRFRDYTLDTTWYGKIFIKCYYAISPALVKLFGNQKWFRAFWKNRLDTMVSNLNNKGIEDTQYQDKY